MTNKLSKLFFLLIILLISISFISAAEIQFTENSSDFNQGQTLIAKVSENFVEQPTTDNVFFYRGHVRIPMVYEALMINDEFYIYALLTEKSAGNYSIALENVKYMQGVQESQQDIVKNFTINGNASDFSVEPGFVNANAGFSLKIQNLQNSKITVDIDVSKNLIAANQVSLNSGEIKQIDFQLDNQEASFSEEIKLTSGKTGYSVPIFVNQNLTSKGRGNGTSSGGTNDGNGSSELKEDLSFSPDIVKVTMATESTLKRIIYLTNTGDDDINDITFLIPSTLDPYVTIDHSKDINRGSSERIEITIESGAEEKTLSGEIIAKSGKIESSFTLFLNFEKDYIPTTAEEQDGIVVTTCVQLKGNVCAQNQDCSGEVAQVADGVCCLKPGVCEEIKKSSTGKVIGWSLVAIVILLLLWFFMRYKRVRSQINLFKIASGRRW